MSQPSYITALELKEPRREELSPEVQKYFAVCDEKIGFVPNVLRAYSFDEEKLKPFMAMYDELMLGESELSKLEREMIAVAVSSVNHCFYCLVAHGSAVRRISKTRIGRTDGDELPDGGFGTPAGAMLDFAVKLTEKPHEIVEADRELLREHGFSNKAIWDIGAVAAFFNMSNRMASAVDMQPNKEYHALFRNLPERMPESGIHQTFITPHHRTPCE